MGYRFGSSMGKGDGKGNAGGFTDEQLEVYKECFKLMGIDKDGVINKNDLRAAFDNVGRLMSDAELDEMLREIGGQCTYDNMVKCFEAKMSGGVNDPDDLIINSIRAYDDECAAAVEGQTIFKHLLTAFGDKLTEDEIDDMFSEFDYDDDTGHILTKSVVDLFVAGGMDEKEEEKKEEEKKGEEKAAEGGEGGEGGKKKKKKKKAAK